MEIFESILNYNDINFINTVLYDKINDVYMGFEKLEFRCEI